ncbi:putative membrane protein [Candidatus Ichthyocystis hellenicum]|uniref:Putative membrane protein n=1 Tax=Candidatus Ichthyocystis hellenicum TaxID=1561003 RepID=A0A0S4M5S0_9BURK|nr:hypothetical protein [Candidatus Ichthyocystis hellenicum]CUT18074.1 putative membrane protein [Candidatus Ichthyocystis hellenicum]
MANSTNFNCNLSVDSDHSSDDVASSKSSLSSLQGDSEEIKLHENDDFCSNTKTKEVGTQTSVNNDEKASTSSPTLLLRDASTQLNDNRGERFFYAAIKQVDAVTKKECALDESYTLVVDAGTQIGSKIAPNEFSEEIRMVPTSSIRTTHIPNSRKRHFAIQHSTIEPIRPSTRLAARNLIWNLWAVMTFASFTMELYRSAKGEGTGDISTVFVIGVIGFLLREIFG